MKPKSNEPPDYQVEGFRANIRGMKVEQNPHPKGSKPYISWNRGWYTANFGRMMSVKRENSTTA